MIFKKKDKKQHLLAGLALSILAEHFAYPWDWWWKRGTPEWWGSWATVAGEAIGHTLNYKEDELCES